MPQGFQYVDSAAKLDVLVRTLAPEPLIGLDTEFVSEGRYQPLACLVQIAAAGEIWLVDPLAIAHMQPLWKELASATHEIICVGAAQEIRFLREGAGDAPARVLDLQLAAGLLGYGYPLSHTRLVTAVAGATVRGSETFTDWTRRPLSSEQLEYAADDVRHLIAIRNRLMKRAEQMGRVAWIDDECARLVRDTLRDEERWRVAGSRSLSRRQLGALREVWRWRDRRANKANITPGRILRDDLLVHIARRVPSSPTQLFSVRGLEQRRLGDMADEIVQAVQASTHIPEAELPRNNHVVDPPQVTSVAKLLVAAVNTLAAEHGVEPQLLASTGDCEALIRWRLNPEQPAPAMLEGWRAPIVSAPLLALLDGKASLRVRDLRSSAAIEVVAEDAVSAQD